MMSRLRLHKPIEQPIYFLLSYNPSFLSGCSVPKLNLLVELCNALGGCTGGPCGLDLHAHVPCFEEILQEKFVYVCRLRLEM